MPLKKELLDTQSPEQSENKTPDFSLIIARHAEYYDIASENRMLAEEGADEEEVKSKLGRLTERGVQQAESLGLDVLKEALDSGQEVDITFIGSAQEYESPRYNSPNPWAGRRAEETAAHAARAAYDEMARLIEAGQIGQEQVSISTPVPRKPFVEPATRPNHRLVERDVYWSPKSDKPLVAAYKERAKEVIDEEKATGRPLTAGHDTLTSEEISESTALSNREKELWSRGDPELDEFAARIGNETSADVSGRIMDVVSDIDELAQVHHERHPDRKLVVVLVAHDANIGALSSQAFGMERPVIPTFTGRLNIQVRNGTAHLEYDGKSYTSDLPSHER